MKFDEVIENLYSKDLKLICDTLNSGLHISNCGIEDEAVATGFYCKVHTGTIFEVLYLVSQQTICYLKAVYRVNNIPIGWIFKYDPTLKADNNCFIYETGLFRPDEDRNKWYDSYNIETGKFNTVVIKEIKENRAGCVDSFVLDSGMEVASFSITNGRAKVKSYPLNLDYLPNLFKSDKFYPESFSHKNYSRGRYDNHDYHHASYEKYNGIYDLDDDFIDDVLGGIPDAYWNID